jgi:hypothetical protein
MTLTWKKGIVRGQKGHEKKYKVPWLRDWCLWDEVGFVWRLMEGLGG